VKIYLLSIDQRRFFFYADESEASGEEEDAESAGAEPAGLGGRLQARYEKLQAAWQQAESGVGLWTRRAWNWLHSWSHPDETMLLRLGAARHIDLHHPASRSVDEVRTLWRVYLAHRWWRHLLWMSVNTVVAPLMIPLALLPGPNVVGYWFLYRAIYHLLIVWGIWRARRGRIPLELYPIASLDAPIERDLGGKARHVALDGSAVQLDEHVAWSESEPAGLLQAGGPTPGAAPKAPADPGSEKPGGG
jgi:hypothetical protein